MSKETVQNLIEVYNTLYSFPVAGSMVVPMAQVQVTLQKVIADIGRELGEEVVSNINTSEVTQ